MHPDVHLGLACPNVCPSNCCARWSGTPLARASPVQLARGKAHVHRTAGAMMVTELAQDTLGRAHMLSFPVVGSAA